MATFLFEALDKTGKKVRDEIDAPDKKSAVQGIRNKGLKPTAIKELEGGGDGATPATAARSSSRAPAESSRRSAPVEAVGTGAKRGHSVPLKDLTLFTTQLSILQDAGLPIVRSLKILEGQAKEGNFKRILGGVADDVEAGTPLSDAMGKFPKAFDRLFTNMVKAGEAGGVLDVILQRLSEFMEKNQALKRKIIGASVYPIVVMLIAIIILIGIMLFVIPTFKEMFNDMGIPLPGPTVLLLAMSDGLVNFWYLIVAVPVGVIVAFKTWVATESGKFTADKLKLKIPVVGTIIKKGVIGRFTRTLGTLIASGVPILEALAIVKNAIGNEVLAKAIDDVYESIREGETIASPLAQSGLFDDIVVNMIDVGEETGELDKMLIKIADQYDAEVDVAVESMTSILEPIMIVFMGGAVGFIVVSLFLPLISIIQNL